MHRYLLLKQLMLIVLMEQLLLLDHQCASVPVVEAVDVNSVDGAVVVVGSSVCIGTCC